MKVAIMQPYLFPYIGYFQLIKAVDKFIVLDDVNYINKGWINRNNILINGKSNMFTVPLKEASQNKLINEIEISGDLKWKDKLLRTIEQNYKKSPYYNSFSPVLFEIINNENKNLSEFIYFSLIKINEYLGIDTSIIPSSSIYNNQDLKAQNKIIDICLKESADTYINPIGGVELYDKHEFEKNNLTLFFIKSNDIQYKQFNNDFVPWLSILDVIMFNSKDQIHDYLDNYSLI
jgi:hypothetical protein